MITIYPSLSVLIYFICTNTNNRIIVNNPRCKHHLKSLHHVTPLYLQSRTTVHTKIHPKVLVHKIPPIKSAIRLSLHFTHMSIISTQAHFSHHSQKHHKFLKTWQLQLALLKTQDGYVPTTRNALVNYLHLQLTRISVQVHYATIWNELSLQKHPYFIYFLQSSLWIF